MSIMESKNFAEKVRSRREQLDLSQKKLAQKIGTYQSRVAEWEAGKSLPSLPLLLQLAKKLDISIDYLVDDDIAVGDLPEVRSNQERDILFLCHQLGLEEARRRLLAMQGTYTRDWGGFDPEPPKEPARSKDNNPRS